MDNDPSTPAPAALDPNTPAEEEGPNERIADGSQFVMDWLRGSALYQQPIIAVPQPISRRQPQVQAVENSLVEASGRAMILRLRKLYEKDTKLFLRAQNDVGNAIFKYEVEDS